MKKAILAACALFAAVIFCGCPLKATITCEKDDSFSVNFSSNLGAAFVENLSQLQDLEQISKKIESELNNSYFRGTLVRIDQKSLWAQGLVPNIKSLPKEFISVQKKSDGKRALTLTLGPQSLASSILKENSAAKTMADILMAPIISGEEMSLSEYKDLLGEIYGPRLASEILAGDLVIDFVDKASGKKQTKKIPVADLLLSTEPRSFVFEY
ncbi:MAG: hypothetical protein IK094_06515 [Treponema sp.]|nr:hypothetical protein [Treponema sp.]